MTPLKTSEGIDLLSRMRSKLKSHLELVDAEIGVSHSPELDQLLSNIFEARIIYASSSDDVLNDIFVLEKYVKLFGEYGFLWRQIASSQFSESWSNLQCAFELIRLIRRFSCVNVSAIEDQLYALESLYPYNIFFSMGAVVEQFECSICGKDIDSFECMHRKGELYRGQMAYGIARNIVQLDHFSVVEHPVDKRCVVSYSNDAPQFSAVRYLGDLLTSKTLLVSNFGGVAWGKQRLANPEHRSLGRNDPCYCQSGRKFKKCCIDKAFIEQDHAQILQTRSIIERTSA
jgi:hypothetical protein